MKRIPRGSGDMRWLTGRIISIIGYGNQGSAWAKCLRDAGLNIIVGVRRGGRSFRLAENDRMKVLEIEEAVERGDVICVLIPDVVQKEVYERKIAKHLREGDVLCFAHGYNVVFELIRPPKYVDVIMLAPKATGGKLREAWLREEGVPALLSIYQDSTGNAMNIALGLAKALRFTNKVLFRCTFREETLANLFAEQCVTIGGLMELIKAGFETLVEKGIPPEVAYFECVGVTRLVADLIEEQGLKKTVYGISEVAAYGGLTRGRRIITSQVKKKMVDIFDEIASGRFTEEFRRERMRGLKGLNAMKKAMASHMLEKIGKKIRGC